MLRLSNHQIWIIFLPVALVVILSLALEPSWMTNDDAAMSMIAHGYGAISEASPKLIFSNIYWGKLVQLLPTIGGLYGYSLAAIFTIVISGMCYASLLLINTQSALVTSLVVILILFQAILFPQFTVTAGLVSVAAVLMLFQYSQQRHYYWLALACVCIFLGYIIRREEAILVCTVALPLLPWASLLKQTRFLLTAGATLAIIISVTVIDQKAYDKPEWQTYQTLLPSLVPLVAYNATPSLLARPELLEKHNFSKNDIELLTRWFWFDTEIASAERLNALTSELGSPTALPLLGKLRVVSDWRSSVKKSFTAVLDQSILSMVLCALLLFLVFPSKRLLISWLLFFAALAMMGTIGRPGELRVYFPIISLLILTPLILNARATPRFQYKKSFHLALTILVSLHSLIVVQASIEKRKISDNYREKLTDLPNGEMIAGYYSSFKANHVYSVTGAANLADKFNNLYLFGWPAIAPYSFAYLTEKAGEGFKQQLMSPQGVWVLLNNERLLEKYCTERKWKFIRLAEASPRTGGAKKLSCVAN